MDRCFYCGCRMVLPPKVKYKPGPPNTRTRDHVMPRCRGGGNQDKNIVWACRGCNEEKRPVDDGRVPFDSGEPARARID
jgi:5-methylcytosine-specific restriction endonuclease McrA